MFRDSALRVDALSKVTGKAKYAADLNVPEALWVKVLMCPHPHARVLSIDAERAKEVPGVAAVLAAADIPGIPCQKRERPVLAPDVARFAGDGVALVAAESQEIASRAARLIQVKYEPLPAAFDPEAALAEAAPRIHGDSNVVCHHKVRKGDVEVGFAESEVVLERVYRTHRVQHAALEPEAAVAVPSGPDEMTVYCPCKSPFNVRRMVAETLGAGYNQVRVVQAAVGGSFGGKDSDMGIMASRVALVARATGRPAKMVFSREESIIDGTKRHPYLMKYKVGARRDGRLCAMRIQVLADAGAYASKTPLVAWRSVVEAAGPYVIPNVWTDVIGVFTNNASSDALRGFGSPQVNFGVELLMDELALELGIDPLELRLINGFDEGSVSATGQKLQAVCLKDCLHRAAEMGNWRELRRELAGQPAGATRRRGVGLACAFRGVSLGAGGEGVDSAGVTVSVQRDGSVTVSSGISEVGQGFSTVACRIVAETLGIDLAQVRYNPVDTSATTDSGPTVASRGTVLGGNAAKIAAEKVRDSMAGAAAGMLGLDPAQVQFKDGFIGLGDITLPFCQVAEACHQRTVCLHHFGWWAAPPLPWDRERGQGEAYFSYTYGADLAEVEVDLVTGKVEILDLVAVHDVGRAINSEEVKAQIAGGAAMGIGYALTEEVRIREGRIQNTNLDTYLIPTSLDVRNVRPVYLEYPDHAGPYGARGLGEPATQIVAPAIVNAVCHALGRRIRSLPAGLEEVLAAAEGGEER